MTGVELLDRCPVVPVVTIEDAAHAAPLAEALQRAGVSALEITLRTPCAIDAIRAASGVDGMLVGAGSIRQVEQVGEVVEAGAAFCVSPGYTPSLLAAAEEACVPIIPGVATASEILQLLERGLSLVKFFPAEINGGSAAIRALSAPIPEVRFFPTGGINASNLRDYLSVDAVTCVGGSWFVPGEALVSGDFGRIEKLAAEAMELARACR